MIPPTSNRHTITGSCSRVGSPLGRRLVGYDGDELVTREDAQLLYHVRSAAWFFTYGNPVASIYPTREPLYSLTDLDTAMLGRAPGAKSYLRVLGAPPGSRGYFRPLDAHPEAGRYRSPYLPRDSTASRTDPNQHRPYAVSSDDGLVTALEAASRVSADLRRTPAEYVPGTFRELPVRPQKVEAATLRRWVARGYLNVAAVTLRRRANLYRYDDVLQAAHTARANTRRPTPDQGQNLPAEHLDALLTTADAAILAGVAQSTVRMWVKRGRLTPAQPGTRPKYRAADVLALIRAHR